MTHAIDHAYRYRNPIYVSSGSNGLTKAEVSEMLPQPDNHSPVHTEPHHVSYDIPKFKLTQERALPLIHWFEEHQDHPYPSRQEKLNLCQATQLTYTQVSTFVACSILSCHSLKYAASRLNQ